MDIALIQHQKLSSLGQEKSSRGDAAKSEESCHAWISFQCRQVPSLLLPSPELWLLLPSMHMPYEVLARPRHGTSSQQQAALSIWIKSSRGVVFLTSSTASRHLLTRQTVKPFIIRRKKDLNCLRPAAYHFQVRSSKPNAEQIEFIKPPFGQKPSRTLYSNAGITCFQLFAPLIPSSPFGCTGGTSPYAEL